MAVFKKQGVYWIDYYVNGRRKRERIGPDKRLAETVLRKRKVKIAEGKWLDKQKPITTTFDKFADAYVQWIAPDPTKGIPPRKRSWKSAEVYALTKLREYFSGENLLYLASWESLTVWAPGATRDSESRVSGLAGDVEPGAQRRSAAQRRHAA